jgi:hypothetical protein
MKWCLASAGSVNWFTVAARGLSEVVTAAKGWLMEQTTDTHLGGRLEQTEGIERFAFQRVVLGGGFHLESGSQRTPVPTAPSKTASKLEQTEGIERFAFQGVLGRSATELRPLNQSCRRSRYMSSN